MAPTTRTLPPQAVTCAARFLLAWAPATNIRTYLITDHPTLAEVSDELAEHAATHRGGYDQIGLDLSMRVLTVHDAPPDLFLELAGILLPAVEPCTDEDLRHLLTLTRARLDGTTAATCRRLGLTLPTLADWLTTFTLADLNHCLGAGCTLRELLGYLHRGTLPAGTALLTLRALRTDTPRPATGPR